jgi:hypothetical protein
MIGKAAWSLRIGFAAMYAYSGVDIMLHPRSWLWAVPNWFVDIVSQFMAIETFLRIQAAGELAFALAFLLWFLKPRMVSIVAALAAFEMAGILAIGKTGIDSITFRDLGLLGGLIALCILLWAHDTHSPQKERVI